jgi:hypothetical protein
VRAACTADALGGLLAHDDRAELLVITDEHHLLGTVHQRDEALGLRGLRRLVHQHLAKAKVGQARVAGAHAGGADDVGVLQDLALGGPLERLVLAFVGRAQLAQLVLELLQLAQLARVRRVQVAHLVVQGQELDRRRNHLAALGAQPHHLEPRGVDALGQVVDCHVAGRADQDLALVLLRQVVHNGGRGHRLARARRALDQHQRALQRRLDRADLRVVELGQPGRREALGQHDLDGLRLDVVAQQPVVDVARHRRLLHRERAHGGLHAVERGALPHKLHREAVHNVGRHAAVAAQLQPHLLAYPVVSTAHWGKDGLHALARIFMTLPTQSHAACSASPAKRSRSSSPVTRRQSDAGHQTHRDQRRGGDAGAPVSGRWNIK